MQHIPSKEDVIKEVSEDLKEIFENVGINTKKLKDIHPDQIDLENKTISIKLNYMVDAEGNILLI